VGAWGTAIFADDLACDVRDGFRDLIGDGESAEEATSDLLAVYGNLLDEPGEGSVFWIALALSQSRLGRLLDEVRDQAVGVIDRCGDLAQWDGASRSKRRQALVRARAELVGVQRAPVTVRRRVRSSTPFEPGDVVVYEHDSGAKFVFWVVRNTTDKGGTYSRVEVLDLDPADLPDAIPRLGAVPGMNGDPGGRTLGLVLLRCQRLPEGRWHVAGRVDRPSDRPPIGGTTVFVNPGSSATRIQHMSLDRVLDRYIR
jgi:hypothetical protein